VLGTPKVKDTVGWFRHHLGFICSDDVYAGEKDNLIGSFNRIDGGETFVDHHVFFAINHSHAGLNHISFEVQDMDDVFMGHQHMRDTGKYEHMWGIGRHLLGSQVYDYWADPWRRVHEHWADSDRLNIKNGSNLLSPRRRWFRSGAIRRRRSSSSTSAPDRIERSSLGWPGKSPGHLH
jgi:hypothetical protein